jgi:hypothetical protein
MAGTIRRGKAVRADLALWDGKTSTYTRTDATGGTITGLAIGNEVDVLQVYGAGTARTYATLKAAADHVGTDSVTFVLAPGTWTIDTNLTLASNITLHLPAGCVLSPDSGITLTVNGATLNEATTVTGGSGTVTFAGGRMGPVITSAETSASVTPTDYSRRPFPFYDATRYGLATSASAATNTTAIQRAINVAEQAGGGTVWIPDGDYNFSGGVDLKDGVSIIGAGPFATALTCTTAGVNGFEASSALSGITLADFQLVGTNATNASEDGIHIAGDSSGGFPKLVIQNLLVKQWGNIGIYLSNCFDALVLACNSSSNKSHGFHFVSCFSMGAHKNVAFQNVGHGFYIQSAAGSFFSGTAQENSLNGWRVETAQGCTFATYCEQNGHAGSTTTTAQFLLTQRSGGFAVSSGNKVNIFALGGKGSTSPTYESGYGVYFDFAEDNEVNGSIGGHLTNDIIFTSNSSRNDIRTVKYLTGLSGGDTTTPVVNNSTAGTNLIPVKVNYTNATAGTANVGTGEDDLMTFSLPASSLFLNQQAIEIIAWGNTGNNANNKRVKLYFGSTVLIDTGTAGAQARDWELRAVVTRLSATSQQGIARGNFNQASLASDFTSPTETLTSAVTIKVTGEGTSDGDITQRGLIVRGL